MKEKLDEMFSLINSMQVMADELKEEKMDKEKSFHFCQLMMDITHFKAQLHILIGLYEKK